MALKELLMQNGVNDALVKNNISLDGVLEGMTEEIENIYSEYTWDVIVLDAPDGSGKVHIVQAYPKNDPQSWEEWFAIGEEIHHHIYVSEKKAGFDLELDCPIDDPMHPAVLCGRTWFFAIDAGVKAYLSR